ncbi:Hypothetical protein A7982_03086 [Minicystis rosea]|nr:Hypothetical protein A7982_03086 [Minicystis rosea]
MPVPIIHVSRRVTVEKQGTARRPFSCASCGHRAEVEIFAAVRAQAEESITASEERLAREAHERADAHLADEQQLLFELLPCPKCGARSDDAALYRQNTVLLCLLWLGLGGGFGVYNYLVGAVDRRPGQASPIALLVGSLLFGVALAGWCWYLRAARVKRVARVTRFVEPEAPPRKPKGSRKAAS